MLTWKEVLVFSEKGNPTPSNRVEKTEEEWKALLTPEQFRIARMKGTEPSFSGELCEAHDPGIYSCICCGTELFDSTIKFDSGTGWPSFTQPITENAIKYDGDFTLSRPRIEVMCNNCDGHLGHVFPDGPAPSNLRYCINSEAIQLKKNFN